MWQFFDNVWTNIETSLLSILSSCDTFCWFRQMYSMFHHDSVTLSTSTVLQTHCVLSAYPHPRLWPVLILLLWSTFSFPRDPMSTLILLESFQTGFVHFVICTEVIFISFHVSEINFSYGRMIFYCLDIPIYFPVCL